MYLDILHVENRGGEAAAFWEEKRRKERGRSEEGKGKKEVKGLRPSASHKEIHRWRRNKREERRKRRRREGVAVKALVGRERNERDRGGRRGSS
ncbi:hypothetical protein BHE74_00004125 [Ensete ventricosum]|nr:hypothetical protein BHE74_00004125 [Ensete ventricosum]